jgi:hypothetical protein
MRTRAADRLLLGMGDAAPEEAGGTNTGGVVSPRPDAAGRSNAIRPRGFSGTRLGWNPGVVSFAASQREARVSGALGFNIAA